MSDEIVLAKAAVIDLAMHLVATRALGMPATSREAFGLLGDAGVIDDELRGRLERIDGFRNVAVRECRRLPRAIVEFVIRDWTTDLEAFVAAVIRA